MSLIQHIETLISEKISRPDLYFEAFEHRQERKAENERLEYLGDAVIELALSDFLFHKYQTEREGFLTIMRSKICNRKFLNDIAMKLELHKFVQVDNDITTIKYLYGCILESFIGALYLDFGFEKSCKITLDKILLPYVDFEKLGNCSENHKGALLEYCSKNKKHKIEFLTFQTEDKEAVLFESRIAIDGILQKEVEVASSKKEAEQNLAKKILEKITR